MKTAVFGTGIVGQVIATRLAGLGHSVIVGTRDVNTTLERKEKDGYGNPPFAEWYKQNVKTIKLTTYSDAASSSEIIFNCTKGQGSVDALRQAGEDNLKGRIIIDVANPLDFSKGMPPSLSPGNTDSLGELIQRTFPDVKVVKTLNTMNCYLMVNPAALPGDHNVFVSGNDAEAKSTAKEILRSFGWKDNNIIDLGDITTARGTEQLLPIWIRLYSILQNPMFNFKIVVGQLP
ncbi:MAG TPA: NAD(P)-binding domain-containing protein [Chryseolinea sp.]